MSASAYSFLRECLVFKANSHALYCTDHRKLRKPLREHAEAKPHVGATTRHIPLGILLGIPLYEVIDLSVPGRRDTLQYYSYRTAPLCASDCLKGKDLHHWHTTGT